MVFNISYQLERHKTWNEKCRNVEQIETQSKSTSVLIVKWITFCTLFEKCPDFWKPTFLIMSGSNDNRCWIWIYHTKVEFAGKKNMSLPEIRQTKWSRRIASHQKEGEELRRSDGEVVVNAAGRLSFPERKSTMIKYLWKARKRLEKQWSPTCSRRDSIGTRSQRAPLNQQIYANTDVDIKITSVSKAISCQDVCLYIFVHIILFLKNLPNLTDVSFESTDKTSFLLSKPFFYLLGESLFRVFSFSLSKCFFVVSESLYY